MRRAVGLILAMSLLSSASDAPASEPNAESCTDVTYSCGARVAPSSPGTSATGVFAALLGGAVLGLLAFRRSVSG